MEAMNGWVGVDLDGTLAEYDGWRGAGHIGAPIPAMLERVKVWLAAGVEVRIFTARVSDVTQAATVRAALAEWLTQHGLPVLVITNIKDYGMIELWDDRAVQVEPNTGRPYGPSRLGI